MYWFIFILNYIQSLKYFMNTLILLATFYILTFYFLTLQNNLNTFILLLILLTHQDS